MSAVEPVRTGTNQRFPPSLNLNDIRKTVSGLSEHFLDVLAYIQDGNDALCSVTRTDKAHLESCLNKLYDRLGINRSLPSAEKRRAAALMNKIYDVNGWRPSDEDSTFLLSTRGAAVPYVSESKPSVDPEKVVVPLVENREQAQADIAVQTIGIPLLSAREVAVKIGDLSEWKRGFLNWVVSDLTEEEMLTALQKTDPTANLSSVERGLHQVLKALGIRRSINDEGVRPLLLEAHAFLQNDQQEPETTNEGATMPDQDHHQSESRSASAMNAPPVPVNLDPIVARITGLMSAGKVANRRIELLDAMLVSNVNADLAVALETNEANITVLISGTKQLFEIPRDSADTVKTRAAEERKVLASAWRQYRGQKSPPDTDQPAAPASASAPAPAPASPEILPPPPPVVVALEPPTVVEPDALPEEPPLPTETVQDPSPAPEPTTPETPTPEPRAQESASPVMSATTSDGLLREPLSIRSVRTLWSNSPTFEEDQNAALAQGYTIERVDHVVSFHPVFQGVSVLVLIQRS